MALTKYAVAAAVIGAVAASGAAAQGKGAWEVVREDGRVVYLVRRGPSPPDPSGMRSVQLKRVFKEAPEMGSGSGSGTVTDCSGKPVTRREKAVVAYSLDTVEIDCRNGLYRFTDIAIYDRDDEIVNRYRPTDQLTPIPPSTYLAEVQKQACR